MLRLLPRDVSIASCAVSVEGYIDAAACEVVSDHAAVVIWRGAYRVPYQSGLAGLPVLYAANEGQISGTGDPGAPSGMQKGEDSGIKHAACSLGQPDV